MSAFSKATVIVIAALALGTAVAFAGTPDQSQETEDFSQTVGNGQADAFQTVTPGITGLLDHLEIGVNSAGPCAQPRFDLEIRTVTGNNLPAEKVLGTGVVENMPQGVTFSTVTLDDPIGVSKGKKFAIVSAITGPCGYEWTAGGGEAYLGGRYGYEQSDGSWFAYPDGDLTFNTEVKKARCDGKDATLAGQLGNDTVNGGGKADVIQSYKGDDKAAGRGRGDTICGSAGDDVIKGGPGGDTLIGGSGKDKCVGGPGRDKAIGCEQKLGI